MLSSAEVPPADYYWTWRGPIWQIECELLVPIDTTRTSELARTIKPTTHPTLPIPPICSVDPAPPLPLSDGGQSLPADCSYMPWGAPSAHTESLPSPSHITLTNTLIAQLAIRTTTAWPTWAAGVSALGAEVILSRRNIISCGVRNFTLCVLMCCVYIL